MTLLPADLKVALATCAQDARALADRFPSDPATQEFARHFEEMRRLLHEHLLATAHARRRLEELERERNELELRCVATEQQFASVSSLFVASSRLPDTLDRSELLGAIQEIVANLLGCEEFAVLERHADGHLAPVHSMGDDAQELLATAKSAALIAEVARAGTLWVSASGEAGDAGITACVPLILGGRVTGVLVLFRMLAHKRVLAPQDRELLDLLGTRAALALHCSKLETHFAGDLR